MKEELFKIATAVTPEIFEFEFTIGTLVTRKTEYIEMLSSFESAGFTPDICEFLYLDNTLSNQFDGFRGLNKLIKKAKGKFIILCHQDVIINKDDVHSLRNCLAELSRKDPLWAVCGNAGARGPNDIVYHISYPEDVFMSKGKFPYKVSSLDENFLLIKNEANLSFSTDLDGFHLYGTDICLRAALDHFNCYVIAFNITHKSRGNLSADFFVTRKKLIKKYDNFFKSRWIQTTFTNLYLSGSGLKIFCSNAISLFFVRMKNGILKRTK